MCSFLAISCYRRSVSACSRRFISLQQAHCMSLIRLIFAYIYRRCSCSVVKHHHADQDDRHQCSNCFTLYKVSLTLSQAGQFQGKNTYSNSKHSCLEECFTKKLRQEYILDCHICKSSFLTAEMSGLRFNNVSK